MIKPSIHEKVSLSKNFYRGHLGKINPGNPKHDKGILLINPNP